MKTALVVGTGAGGATIARELQGEYQVTILEAGKDFKPFSYPVRLLAGLRKTRLFLDERMIRMLLPSMIVEKTKDMVLVRGMGKGGTTTLATGNAVRYDKDLKAIGLDLDQEFEELYSQLPITTDHCSRWTQVTKDMYDVFEDMGLKPVVTPKLLDPEKCVSCGHCAIGCPTDAKWDTRVLIDEAVSRGAEYIDRCIVKKVRIKKGRATSVVAKVRGKKTEFQADLIILAAGGIGTPKILKASGIKTQKRLFVDPVLCVAGKLENFGQDRQLLMPFISQQDGYILSPYMDYLSFFFNKKWRMGMDQIASVMIKLADEEKGDVKRKKIIKAMSEKDKAKMEEAVELSSEILVKMGVPRDEIFLGTLNAGHPGGMLPLTKETAVTLHSSKLPENMYVCDATLLPQSIGNPPILTIMALAKRMAKVITG